MIVHRNIFKTLNWKPYAHSSCAGEYKRYGIGDEMTTRRKTIWQGLFHRAASISYLSGLFSTAQHRTIESWKFSYTVPSRNLIQDPSSSQMHPRQNSSFYETQQHHPALLLDKVVRLRKMQPFLGQMTANCALIFVEQKRNKMLRCMEKRECDSWRRPQSRKARSSTTMEIAEAEELERDNERL